MFLQLVSIAYKGSTCVSAEWERWAVSWERYRLLQQTPRWVFSLWLFYSFANSRSSGDKT